MSLLDQVISEVTKNNILKDEIPIVSPSLNPSDKTQYPDSWEKVSTSKFKDPTDLSKKLDFSVDLRKSIADTKDNLDNTILNQIENEFSPIDLRTSQETGRLIHNWWIYYFKSLKKFINNSFDDTIKNFHYNYANKSIEFSKLYKKPILENPSCIINLDSFTADGNMDPIRRNSGFYNNLQSLELAVNKTTKEIIYCDFKFVNLQQTINLNFNSGTDLLNYYDRLSTVYPMNQEFQSYQFKALINIHDVTENWDVNDEVYGIVWDVSVLGNDHHSGPNTKDKLVQRWGEYYCTPRFTIQSISQMADKQSEKYQLNIGLNTYIRVPQTIFGWYNQYIGIKAIEVVLDIGSSQSPFSQIKRQDENDQEKDEPIIDVDDKPIMMDIDRDVYQSYRIKNSYYLSYNNISNNGKLILPTGLLQSLNNQAAAIYMNTDSTSISSELFWIELGYLYNFEGIIKKENDQVLQNKIEKILFTKQELLDIGITIESDSVEAIVIDIPNFDKIDKYLLDKTMWFNLRLFTFDISADLSLI